MLTVKARVTSGCVKVEVTVYAVFIMRETTVIGFNSQVDDVMLNVPLQNKIKIPSMFMFMFMIFLL